MPYTEMQAGIPVTTIPSDEQLSAAAERVKLDLLLRSLQPPEMETQIAQGWTAAELNRTVKQYEAQGWQVAPASFTVVVLPDSRSWSATINGEEKRLREQYLVMVQRPKPVQ